MNGKNINGILIIDKPEGKSSAYIDFICKKILDVNKVGHIGTLDPFATGVLAIAINNGTKTIPYIKTERKTYEFEIKFGEKTNTSDKTGDIIETSNKIPTRCEIENILPNFIGEILQTPSIFSAIKVNGKRAYELARKGETPDIKQRTVTIFNLELIDEKFQVPEKYNVLSNTPGRNDKGDKLNYFFTKLQKKVINFCNILLRAKNEVSLDNSNEKNWYNSSKFCKNFNNTVNIYKFRAEVSPGTYIRSLTEDIAKLLGTVGYTLSLKRIRDGKFSINSAISLDELRKRQDNIESVLIPLENVLDDIPVILVSCQDAENLLFGRCITTDFSGKSGEYLASTKEGFLEIVDFSNGIISPKKLLRSSLKGE